MSSCICVLTDSNVLIVRVFPTTSLLPRQVPPIADRWSMILDIEDIHWDDSSLAVDIEDDATSSGKLYLALPAIIVQLIIPSTRDRYKPRFRIRYLGLASCGSLQSRTYKPRGNTRYQSYPSIWDWSSIHPASSIWEQIVWHCRRSSFYIFSPSHPKI